MQKLCLVVLQISLQEARSYQQFVFIGEKEIFRLYPIDFAILINVSIVGFPSGDRAL